MDIIFLMLFAWFIFVLGRYFKDFTITTISGILMVVAGVIIYPKVPDTILLSISVANLWLGFYVIFGSIIELLYTYFPRTAHRYFKRGKHEKKKRKS